MMRYQELNDGRTNLPLSKGSIARGRGSYASLIIVMSPMDFLRLTTLHPDNIKHILGVANTSLDDYKNDADEDFRISQHGGLPYLNVIYPGGLIVGHEGRHRAAMVIKSGGTSFPVMLYFRSEYQYALTYEKYDATNDIGEDQEEFFNTRQAADRRAEQLKQSPDEKWSYYRIRVHTFGGTTLKGHPDRSDFSNWKYAAWKPSDMPEYLIGQFDPSIKISSAKMRIGIVKGYNRFS